MSDPARQLREDRELRDAARGLVQSDIGFIRESVAARSLPARLADRICGGARDIADEAAVVVDENRIAVGASVALSAIGLAAWVFREPIKTAVGKLLGHREPDSAPARSDDN